MFSDFGNVHVFVFHDDRRGHGDERPVGMHQTAVLLYHIGHSLRYNYMEGYENVYVSGPVAQEGTRKSAGSARTQAS